MRILIVGAGKSGLYLAEKLRGEHKVTIVEQRAERAEDVREKMPDVKVVHGDGCEPDVLDRSGVGQVDMVAALTGDDEDNLVVALLSKFQNEVPLVFARINHPSNEWLFTKDWGVDAGISSARVLYDLVEKQTSLGDIITLLSLQAEDMAIEEIVLPSDAESVGKTVADLELPDQAQIMAIISNREIKVVRGETVLDAGDQILLLADVRQTEAVREALGL